MSDDSGFCKNVMIFGVDNKYLNSYLNSYKDILILSKGPKDEYYINFSE